MPDEVFQPGDRVPETGIYQVQHYRHRLYHEVTITTTTTPAFPECSECGSNVRFRMVRGAPSLTQDRNFLAAMGHTSR